jgi:hypothetical protein
MRVWSPTAHSELPNTDSVMKLIQVQCYSGYRDDERPTRMKLDEQFVEIVEVEDRWYSPGETYFRVRVEGGDRYVLRHVEAQDIWFLEGYRSGAN